MNFFLSIGSFVIDDQVTLLWSEQSWSKFAQHWNCIEKRVKDKIKMHYNISENVSHMTKTNVANRKQLHSCILFPRCKFSYQNMFQFILFRIYFTQVQNSVKMESTTIRNVWF